MGERLVEEAVAYIIDKIYPDDADKNRKRQIRTKAEKFVVDGGELFYKPEGKDGQVRMPSL